MSKHRLQEFHFVGKMLPIKSMDCVFLRRSKSIRKYFIGVTKDSGSFIS